MASNEHFENDQDQEGVVPFPDISRFQHFLRNMSALQNRIEAFVRTPSVLNQGLYTTRFSIARGGPDKDSFCGCYTDKLKILNCECGEYGKRIEWVWDKESKSSRIDLGNKNKDVKFHQYYSNGTAIIRGTQPMSSNQHYWEVKMISQVYGTDMMVGVGTPNVDVHQVNDQFCSVLGIDSETWGLSYTGLFHHKGKSKDYATHFGQGSIIGVHLDMWNGTLSFYKNRKPLGIVATGLKGKTLYAMASSTAARSGMRIIQSCSFPSSLQFLCCLKLRESISLDKNVLDVIKAPPGLKIFLENNLGWLLGQIPLDEHLLKQSCTTSILSNSNRKCDKHKLIIMNPTEHQGKDDERTSEEYLGKTENGSSSSRLVLVESSSVAFQDFNRFRRSPLPLTFDRECDDSEESDSKKCKYSYNYMVGLSDADSD